MTRWIRALAYEVLAHLIAADFAWPGLPSGEVEERFFAVRECRERAQLIREGLL